MNSGKNERKREWKKERGDKEARVRGRGEKMAMERERGRKEERFLLVTLP